MPIRIKKNETQKDFISRCIGVEIDSGKDIQQATAICYSYWENKNMSSQERVLNKINTFPIPKK